MSRLASAEFSLGCISSQADLRDAGPYARSRDCMPSLYLCKSGIAEGVKPNSFQPSAIQAALRSRWARLTLTINVLFQVIDQYIIASLFVDPPRLAVRGQ